MTDEGQQMQVGRLNDADVKYRTGCMFRMTAKMLDYFRNEKKSRLK